MQISTPSDSGRIGSWEARDGTLLFDLATEGDYAGHWFYFGITDAPSPLPVVVRNWEASYYAGGWPGYRPFYRVGADWERAEAATISSDGCAFLVPGGANTEVAWYQPYPAGRSREWMGEVAARFGAEASDLGPPDLSCLELGSPDEPTMVVIGRQHPGEAMASFLMEGLVSSLFGAIGASGRPIRVVVVPVMNPSGVARGCHRLSPDLVDFNRTWSGGASSPNEVDTVRRLISDLPRVDLFLDIHGDEDTRTCEAYLRRVPKGVLSRHGRVLQDRLATGLQSGLPSTLVLAPRSTIRSLAKRMLRPSADYRPATSGQKQTASDFVSRTYRIPAYTIEVAAHRTDPQRARDIGTSIGEIAHAALTG